jgi:predicted ATPase
MLEYIKIKRFKTLFDNEFPCSSLCLFCGLNGMGKSSLIQTLLLLRQSWERHTLVTSGLLLNGNYLNLGTGKDILSENADRKDFEFNLKWEGREPINFDFLYKANSDLQPINNFKVFFDLSEENLFNRNFQYLSADRIGPRSTYEISDYNIGELNSIGNQGEYAVHFIAENALKSLSIPELKHKDSDSLAFLDNLNYWMGTISPGVRIIAVLHRDANKAVLSFRFVQGKDITADFNPQNVGFGLSYVLPVMVALLRSKPGDLVIIENPESHLHPAGQAVLGRLCAMVASHGVQLIIESHSDHFLNGIRVAVKCKLLSPEAVSVFFLQREISSVNHKSDVIQPRIDSNGHLDTWPEGFLDEWDKQLEQLL